MGLTNIEGIERLECIAVFTEVALSGNLHSFCTQLCTIWKCDSDELLERKLVVSVLLHYLRQGSSEKGLI